MSASLTIGGREVAPITYYDVTVDAGRDSVEEQPDATVLTCTLSMLAGVAIGEPVLLTDSDGVLFYGWVTDQGADLVVQAPGTQQPPLGWNVQTIATGPLAVLGHKHAGTADYPQETDTARIIRVLDEAGLPHLINPGIIGPPLLARTAQPDAAERLARSAANDGEGVLWEQPADPAAPLRYTPQRLRRWAAYRLAWGELPEDLAWTGMGDVTWNDFDSDHLGGPIGTPPALELDPGRVFAEATFTQQISDLARSVTVTYGQAPVDGARPVVTVGSGSPVKDYDTQLALTADATNYADDMLRRQHEPAWRLEGIRIPLHALTPGDRQAIRAALTVGTRLTVPFPLGSPVGYLWQGFLEGWKHHLVADEVLGEQHYLELRASERSLTEASDRWQDIAPTITWDGTAPDLRWIDALTWEAAR
jgi:hypothetical protein